MRHNTEEILFAIKKAHSKKFKMTLKKIKNPYGDGKSSHKIVKIIKRLDLINFNTQKKITY